MVVEGHGSYTQTKRNESPQIIAMALQIQINFSCKLEQTLLAHSKQPFDMVNANVN